MAHKRDVLPDVAHEVGVIGSGRFFHLLLYERLIASSIQMLARWLIMLHLAVMARFLSCNKKVEDLIYGLIMQMNTTILYLMLLMSSEAGETIYRKGTFTASNLLSCLRHLLTLGYDLLVMASVFEPNFHLKEIFNAFELRTQL